MTPGINKWFLSNRGPYGLRHSFWFPFTPTLKRVPSASPTQKAHTHTRIGMKFNGCPDPLDRRIGDPYPPIPSLARLSLCTLLLRLLEHQDSLYVCRAQEKLHLRLSFWRRPKDRGVRARKVWHLSLQSECLSLGDAPKLRLSCWVHLKSTKKRGTLKTDTPKFYWLQKTEGIGDYY